MAARSGTFAQATQGAVPQSIWAMRLVYFAVLLAASAAVLHRFTGLLTPVALNAFMIAFALSVVAIGLAVAALAAVWASARDGTVSAIVAALLAGAMLAWPASYLPHAMTVAPLNDVSTDTSRPPQFTAAATRRPKGANSTEYPGARSAEIQRELYPDISPLIVPRNVSDAFELSGQALRRLGLEIVLEQAPEQSRFGIIEAVDRTFLLGFRDDVVVRIARARRGARIDVRSSSRWGTHDFGANAQRVRAILTAIVERLELTVPAAAQN